MDPSFWFDALNWYGHVAYQIKGNDTYSNMVVIFGQQTHTWPLGWGQKVKHFLFWK